MKAERTRPVSPAALTLAIALAFGVAPHVWAQDTAPAEPKSATPPAAAPPSEAAAAHHAPEATTAPDEAPAAAPAPADAPAAPPVQEPARGPADLMNRANAPQPGRDMQGGGSSAPHPTAAHAGAMMEGGGLASAAPDRLTPPGSVRITVRDPAGQPVADADVQLGIMRGGGQREAKATRTDATGGARFDGLDTGSAAAYRINLLYDGAKVSSMPFRLPEDAGYRVSLTRAPTSRDPKLVFQMIGQTMVELKDERLHVTTQARLTNVGSEIYLFPKGGQFVPLPEGYVSPQFQEVMTDQKLVEKEGEGFSIQGSLPPGTVTLAWAYDLPREGSEARIVAQVPWRTYMYRVISEAPEGLTLRVPGMPEPQPVTDQGTQLLVTQVQHGPNDPPMKQVVLHLTGIPGPGPARWVALALALIALALAGLAAIVPGRGEEERRRLVGERKDRLLSAVRELDAQKEAGDVGPEFYQERLEALVNDLAVVLRDEQLLEQRGQKPSLAAAVRS